MPGSRSVAQVIQAVGRPVFTTREIAALGGHSISVASQVLGAMAGRGLVTRAARGVWCVPADPRFTRYALVPYLAGGHRAYVSFLSALHLHGIIAQIPQVVYVATTGPTRTRKTPAGTFSFHRIAPSLFAGFDWYGDRRDFLIASPEKALVDSLYLSSRRGRRFRHFPELQFGKPFSFRRAGEWVRRIPDPRVRRYVGDHLEALRARNASGG